MIRRSFWLTIVLCFSFISFGFAQVDNSDERKERVKENLLFLFPQLEDHQVVVQSFTSTNSELYDKGAFIIDGQQQQLFLTSSDDTEFYLLAAGPFDVSKTSEELESARQAREEEERKHASEIDAALKPAVEGMPSKGPADAPVTIIEFSDFQCPYCARAAETIAQVIDKNSEDVRLVYVQFPIESIHPWARTASIASLCAANQSVDAFWTLHDEYFNNQAEIDSENVIEKSKSFLEDSGIDMNRWSTCATDNDSDAFKAASALVDESLQLGVKYGINSTPGFFINGRSISGAQPAETFQEAIDRARQ